MTKLALCSPALLNLTTSILINLAIPLANFLEELKGLSYEIDFENVE